MDQEEYYEVSKRSGLPLRCPILNYCARRAWTIYYNSDYDRYNPGLTVEEALLRDDTLPSDFSIKKIEVQGEPPSWIKGNSSYFFTGMCPEVNLFDSGNSLIRNQACVSAEYDKYYKDHKLRILKNQHYSECAEFNTYLFEQTIKSKPVTKKPRKSIPVKVRAVLQKEVNSICPICSNEDVEHFQIHHIDENPSNNELINLLMLCPNCHSKITKGDITYNSVVLVKRNLKK